MELHYKLQRRIQCKEHVAPMTSPNVLLVGADLSNPSGGPLVEMLMRNHQTQGPGLSVDYILHEWVGQTSSIVVVYFLIRRFYYLFSWQ